MSKIFFIILSGIVSQLAFATAPECVNVGSKSEGWKLPNGQLSWDSECNEKVVYCGAVGTRSEGWYVAKFDGMQLIGWSQCSESRSDRPVCVNVGSRSEGWKTATGKLRFDKCANKVAACSGINTRSEGWYAVEPIPETVKLLGWTKCSQE